MAAATAKATNATLDDLLLALSEEMLPVSDAVAKFGEPVMAGAWSRGLIEFGRAKYCIGGNPESPSSNPCLILETGIDWGGAKTARQGRLKDVLAWKPPVCVRYQRYQQEVQVSREKDAWEWVTETTDINGREVRWARRESNRKEVEAALTLYVRLTDAGAAALQVQPV